MWGGGGWGVGSVRGVCVGRGWLGGRRKWEVSVCGEGVDGGEYEGSVCGEGWMGGV